jgi:hypothetical protein
MTEQNAPLVPRPLHDRPDVPARVMSARELRDHGVPPAVAQERCRPDGPWRMPLPGVFLLHPGPLTEDELVQAALCYTGRDGEAVISGLAALALHGFTTVPPLTALDAVDVLVPRTRRLRSAGWVRVHRVAGPPPPVWAGGHPLAPVPRALTDAVARLDDPVAARRLLGEAMRGGHCAPDAVIAEFARARLLNRPDLAAAVDDLRRSARAEAEERLMAAVRLAALPDPFWHVGLWLPGGPFLGPVDAYWPEYAVAVRLDDDVRPAVHLPGPRLPGATRRDRTMAGLGITVLRFGAGSLLTAPAEQAELIRSALLATPGAPPAGHVVVQPR